MEMDMCSGGPADGRTMPQLNAAPYDISRLGFGTELDAATWDSIPQPTIADDPYSLYQCAMPMVPWVPDDPYNGSCSHSGNLTGTFYAPSRREMMSASCSSHSTVGYEETSPPISPCQGMNTSTLSRLDPVSFATFDYAGDGGGALSGFGDSRASGLDAKSGSELFQYQVPALNQWNAYCYYGYGMQGMASSALTGDESGCFGDLNGVVCEQYDSSRAMPCSYGYPTSLDGYSGGQNASEAAAAAALSDNVTEITRQSGSRRSSILDEDIFRSGELGQRVEAVTAR